MAVLELENVVSHLIANARENDVPRRPTAILKHPNAPVTGNLKYNSLKVLKVPNGVYIYVNENIAPYMPYTNERWISPRWKGAQNPNEKWWEKMTEKFIEDLATELGGKVRKI